MPNQTASIPRARTPNARAIGPVPLRTARGAGRFDLETGRLDFERLVLRLDVDAVVGFLPLLRDRVLEVPRPALLDVEEVLLLREPGGEDVRVAMPPR